MRKIFYFFSLLSIGFMLSFMPTKKKIVVIDAGHGGNDFGVSRNQINEKDITLKIAKKIQAYAKESGSFEVVLTRTDDSFPTLTERTDKINEISPDYVISLHMNGAAKNTTMKGYEIYKQSNNEKSHLLAEKFATKLGSKIYEKKLHILANSKSPAILVELGFLTNEEDRAYFSSEEGQNTVAKKFVEILGE